MSVERTFSAIKPDAVAAGHAGEKSGFRKRELLQALPKVKFRCRPETVVPVAHGNLVGVHAEDLRLGKPALDLNGQQGFLDLPAKALFRSQKEHFGDLLG